MKPMLSDKELRHHLRVLSDAKKLDYAALARDVPKPNGKGRFNVTYFQQYVQYNKPEHLHPEVREAVIQKLQALGILSDEGHSYGEPDAAVATPRGFEDYHAPSNMEGTFTMEQERRAVIALINQLDRAGLQHIHTAVKAQIALLEREIGNSNPLGKRAGR